MVGWRAQAPTLDARQAPALVARAAAARLPQLLVLASIALGLYLRAARTLASDSPLGDGGMFYVMLAQLKEAQLHLPWFVAYNKASIPFAYPPLAFYVGAWLASATPLSISDVLRIVPLAATCLTLGAFWLLARAMLRSSWQVAAAVAAFALIPRAFLWQVMGGGLPRATGFLFAILALWQGYLMFRERRTGNVIGAALFSGLTLLSHIQTASFLAVSLVFFYVAFGRTRRHAVLSALVALGAGVVAAPWWGMVLWRYGPMPLEAAFQSGSGGLPVAELATLTGERLAFAWMQTGEPIPIIGALAVAGVWLSLRNREWLLPAWWATVVVLQPRAEATYSTLPMALLAGISLTALIPRLRQLLKRGPGTRRAVAFGGVLMGGFLLTASVQGSAGLAPASPQSQLAELVPLPPAEQSAMSWARTATPPSSRFAIVTGKQWALDRSGEWFPALADRTSVATVQGQEWLPGFGRRVEAYRQLQECADATASCLDDWAHTWQRPFDYVYLPTPSGPESNAGLLSTLREDAGYQLAYEAPGVTIFRRT